MFSPGFRVRFLGWGFSNEFPLSVPTVFYYLTSEARIVARRGCNRYTFVAMSTRSSKLWYTLKLMIGLAFLAFAVWLSYWLLFQYHVRNLVGLGAIILFLVIPSIIATFKIPREIRWLIAVWLSDDPEVLDKALGDIRERQI